MRRRGDLFALALALPVAVVAAYWPALRGGFIWDDDAHVTRPDLRSLHGLWRIWSEPGATQQYYPVLHSAFWLEHRAWGDAPLGYHAANVLLHLLVCVLLYAVLRRLSVPGAVLGVTIFALHPVCVESVAWISEQKNTLSSVFYLSAALAFFRWDDGRRRRYYALGSVLFFVALLSKSVTATLPAALLVVLWWKRGRLSLKGDVLPLLPWFGMSAVAAWVTANVERTFIGARGAAFEMGLTERVLVAGRALWFYLAKVLWPADLVFVYPRWTVDSHAAWQYAFPVMALAALATLFHLRARSRAPCAAALLYAGTLFPALGFINVYPFVFSYVADHFQYLAAAFLTSALAAAVALGARRLPEAYALPAQAASFSAACVLGILTWKQCGNYTDLETFYGSIIARNPTSWLAQDNLGVVLAQRGRFEDASAHYREAIRLNPAYPEAYNNYGNLLAKTGRWHDAEAAYAGALRARPSFAAAEYNWGFELNDAGRYPEAEIHFRNALRLKADYAEAYYGLGNAQANAGHLPEAVSQYARALSIRPEFPEAHANLGLAFAEQGRWAEALAQVTEAVRERPGYAEAHAYLGFALAGSGRLEDAVKEYREALRCGPDTPDIHYQIGMALEKLGRAADAAAEFDTARHGRPGAAR